MEVLVAWADDIARAFRGSGPDLTERSIFGGSAFFVGDAFVGAVENVSGQLRVRLREELRDDVAARPHFDPSVALPTLLIITDDDRDYARGLVPKAYERAKRPTPRPVARPPGPTPTVARTTPGATRRGRPGR